MVKLFDFSVFSSSISLKYKIKSLWKVIFLSVFSIISTIAILVACYFFFSDWINKRNGVISYYQIYENNEGNENNLPLKQIPIMFQFKLTDATHYQKLKYKIIIFLIKYLISINNIRVNYILN